MKLVTIAKSPSLDLTDDRLNRTIEEKLAIMGQCQSLYWESLGTLVLFFLAILILV